MTVMMKCGHAANATSEGRPCCAICAGLNPDAYVTGDDVDLTGRVAQCPDCKRTTPSSQSLAFFEYLGPGSSRGPKEIDRYYCGCRGWD